MSELSRKQARLLERQISKLYGRNYIPLRTSDSTLTIGDILLSVKDISPIIDSSVFNKNLVDIVEGNKVNKSITSSSAVNVTTKLAGEAILSNQFKLEEAGVSVTFTSDNQLFLKVQGLRQQSIKNFIDFRLKLLELYTKGQISSKVYIVRGLVYADKYYLQFSGSNGGTIGLNLNMNAGIVDAEAQADFSVKWKKDVGIHFDGSNGGVLGYRVSGVRLKRHLLPNSIQSKIMQGMSEADAINTISPEERKALVENDAIEITDLTDEILVSMDSELE